MCAGFIATAPVRRADSVLYDAVENFSLPQGAGFAHVIGETAKVRRIRHRLLERGIARDRIAAEGYWRPAGLAATTTSDGSAVPLQVVERPSPNFARVPRARRSTSSCCTIPA